jgi:plasmid stability protein
LRSASTLLASRVVATLHVRNVPEPLYEALRACADREGRSIAVQATMLLEQALLHGRGRPRRASVAFGPGRTPFLRRFAGEARSVVVRAQEHARELGAAEVTPAHVLLAMLEDDVLGPALHAAGITEETVRDRAPRGEESPAKVPFAAETKALLENALRASLASQRAAVAPEHLLAAAGGAPSLGGLPLPPPEAVEPAEAADDYRAVALEGSAAAWTATLNELAEEGWELVSVTRAGDEPRAIFRRV